MVLRYGMDETLGPVAWDTEEGQFLDQPGAFWRPRRFSEKPRARSTRRCRRRCKARWSGRCAVLRANRAALDEGAESLLAQETLTATKSPCRCRCPSR